MGEKSRKVLVVDDEKVILEVLEYNLEPEGYQVESACDGEKAVVAAARFKPNLMAWKPAARYDKMQTLQKPI